MLTMNNKTIINSFNIDFNNVNHSKTHHQYIMATVTNRLLESKTIVNKPERMT